MKALLTTAAIILLGTILTGCKQEVTEIPFPLPIELEGCRIFSLQNTNGTVMTAMRCPNSTTSVTVRSGKTTRTSVVIDGVTYAPVETNKE